MLEAVTHAQVLRFEATVASGAACQARFRRHSCNIFLQSCCMFTSLHICTLFYTERPSKMLRSQHRDITASDRGLRMGKAMVRQRFFSTLVVAIACLGSAVANALQPSALALESQAQAEFAKVGTAVRERLEREAAGDLIGARIAAHDADAHRYRFLDIRRELSRLHSPSLASPSVAASRNPFLPDASFLAPSASSPARGAAMTIGRREAALRVAYPAWDMYRPHESEDPAGADGRDSLQESRGTPAAAPMGRAGDMYTNGVAKPASGARGAAATDLSATASPGESPREPFLVYRERFAGSETRE